MKELTIEQHRQEPRYPVKIQSTTLKSTTGEGSSKSYSTRTQQGTNSRSSFHNREFAKFAKTKGFHRHRKAESFKKMVYKTKQITHLQVRDSSLTTQEMQTGYRSRPHPPATGATLCIAFLNRESTTKLGVR